jgi:hypothetical protein
MSTARGLVIPMISFAIAAAGCGPSAVTGDDGGGGGDATASDATADAPIDALEIDAAPPVDVDVVITADNAYSFGYGDEDGIETFIQGTRAVTASQIFNCPIGEGPEHYVVPAASAPEGAYLYVVSWDDLAVTQGVLGQFKRGSDPLYTGDDAWEVCATGVNLSQSTVGPTQEEVNVQITACNDGSGADETTSSGWVDTAGAVTAGAIGTLAIGEANDQPAGTFPLVCGTADGGIDADAHWMWFDPGIDADPFLSTGANTFRAYLIFRLAADDIPIID